MLVSGRWPLLVGLEADRVLLVHVVRYKSMPVSAWRSRGRIDQDGGHEEERSTSKEKRRDKLPTKKQQVMQF